MKNIWKMQVARISGALVLISLVAPGAGDAAEWHREVIDPSGGMFSSLRIDEAGNAQLAYAATNESLLKYAFWDQKLQKWFTTVLDKSRGFCSLALDSKQRPHISYLAYGDGQIKYAGWNGSSWHKEVIQLPARDISFYTSIGLEKDDTPTITYYEYQGNGEGYRLALRNVYWNGKYWEVRTVDGTPGSGKFNFLAMDASGNPHVAYANVKYENAGLRYAQREGDTWKIEVLEGATASFAAYSVAITVDKKGVPHITYTDVLNRLVKYATRKGASWDIQSVDRLSDIAYPDRNGIALDENGAPYISYYDLGTGDLKLAHKVDQKWVAEIVDSNFAGFTSSLQVSHGSAFLAYTDERTHVLKFAYRNLRNGAVTSQEPSRAPNAR